MSKGRYSQGYRPFNIPKPNRKDKTTMKNMAKYRLCGQLDATVSGKLLYLILLDICDDENAAVIPQRRISEAIGLSKGTVSRNLRKLRDGGRAANKYIVK